MLSCNHLTYRFPDAASDAVRGVSLAINPGEAVAVMGPNGSGKSTLARLIAGLLTPTSGSVRIDSDNNTEPADRVGMLFQNPDNQMVSVLVDQEIAFALENRAVPMAEMATRVEKQLAAFGIPHLANRVTSYLSGGEKQRVALASLMIYNPPILILDEPDSFLDAAGRRLLREQLELLHRRFPDLIEIRVTQYPEVGVTYPRLLLMDAGNLVADGDAGSVRSSGRFESFADPPAQEIQDGGEEKERATEVSIRAKTVSFAYEPERPLLTDVSFSISSGESTSIVGTTGSGKSTLGLLLAGLITPDRGAVEFTPPVDHQIPIAAVFQQPERQFFLNTVAEEIAYGPNHRGWQLSSDEINRYLEEIGLPSERFAGRDPLTLSMGEKRRLAIGIAIALEPAFILFDEPTAGLDPEGVERFIQISRHLKSRGIGQLVITHERRLIEQVSSQVLVLEDRGRVTQLSTSDFLASRQYRSLVWPSRDD